MSNPDSLDAPATTVRLPMEDMSWEPLSDDEKRQLKLPDEPSWLKHYGQQPLRGSLWGTWRKHPKLKDRFHPEYPDDLEVMIHDGGPRLSKKRPEVAWVRIIEERPDCFMGILLNQPTQLESVKQNDVIRFLAPEGGKYLLMTSEKYLKERSDWVVIACDKCGLTELFDAPSDLMRVVFPKKGPKEEMQMFTAFCGACGGVQIVHHKSYKPE